MEHRTTTPPRLATATRALPLVLVAIVSLACVQSGTIGERGFRPKSLDFESFGLRDMLRTVAHPHGVNVIAELAESDLPEGPARRFFAEDQYRATMFVSGNVEIWKAGPHDLRYSDGRFHVGPLSYTPIPNARLFLFKEHEGDFEFRFHSQRVIVESAGRWTPAIYYSILDVTADGTPTTKLRRDRNAPRGAPVVRVAYPIETLQVGSRQITVDSRDGQWRVDGQPFAPSDRRALILEGVVPFAE